MRFALFIIGLLLLSCAFAQDANLNVALKVPEKYAKVQQGQDLVVELGIMNLAAEKRVDVVVDYSIEDAGGKQILSEQETVAVETKASFVKTLRIPQDMKSGKYTVSADVNVINTQVKSSSQASFEVIDRPKDLLSLFFSTLMDYAWAIAALLVLGVVLLAVWRSRKRIKAVFIHNQVHSIVRDKFGK